MYFFCPLKLQCCHLRPWTRLDCKGLRLSTQNTTQDNFQLALLDSRCWRSTCSDWLCLSSTCPRTVAFIGPRESPQKMPKMGENKLKNGLLRLKPLF